MDPKILTVLLLWILACGARQIPAKAHHLQSRDSEEVGTQLHRQLENRLEKVVFQKRAPEIGPEEGEVLNDANEVGLNEYPIVTPKRAAMLLDRIMVALHHALEDEDAKGNGRKINDIYRDGHYYGTGTALHGKLHSKMAKEKVQGLSPVAGNAKIAYNSPKLPQISEDETNEAVFDDFQEEQLDERSLSQEELVARDNTLDLQRRGHDVSSGVGGGAGKGRVYWRCYFNAVTCF